MATAHRRKLSEIVENMIRFTYGNTAQKKTERNRRKYDKIYL